MSSNDAYIRNLDIKQALSKAYPLIPNTDKLDTQGFSGIARTAGDDLVILNGNVTTIAPIAEGEVIVTLPSEVGIIGEVFGQEATVPVVNLAFPYVPPALPPGVETVFSALGGILINNQIVSQGDITIASGSLIYFQGIYYRGTRGVPAI